MNGKDLKALIEEKDLGVIVTTDFKVGRQCAEAAKKGNKILGMISRTFSCKSKVIVKQLYKSLVRPRAFRLRCTGMEAAFEEGYRGVGEGTEKSDENG